MAQSDTLEEPFFIIRAAAHEKAPDSIVIRLMQGRVNTLIRNSLIIRPKKSSDGAFRFSLPVKQSILPFRLQLWYGKDKDETFVYYALPDDSIDMLVRKVNELDSTNIRNQISFTGKGALKYNVRNLLGQIELDLSRSSGDLYVREFGFANASTGKIESEEYFSSGQYKKYLDEHLNNVKTGIKKCQDSIAKYRPNLGDSLANFYTYEIGTYYYFNQYIKQVFARATNKSHKKLIADFYFDHIDEIKPQTPADAFYAYGIGYRELVNFNIMHELNYKTLGEEFAFNDQYDEIKNIDDTLLRDILITKFFTQADNFQVFINDKSARDSCLYDAMQYIQVPELRSELQTQLLLTSGAEMYEFTFQDSVGNQISLNDLKGKVVMLDFYYYGCAACAIFTKKFKEEVYPVFAGNKGLIVLSVNTDKKAESWLKAIESRKYSVEGALELCTGSAFKHPIFKYYNISSLPFIFFIGKDGRLITTYNGESGTELIKIISAALDDSI